MGNCIKKESGMQWGGEDWSSLAPEKHSPGDHIPEKLYQEKGTSPFPPPATSAAAGVTEVKIKITKKQLEDLLSTMDVQELSVQQVLARLMNASDHFESHHRAWWPALDSIPEVD